MEDIETIKALKEELKAKEDLLQRLNEIKEGSKEEFKKIENKEEVFKKILNPAKIAQLESKMKYSVKIVTRNNTRGVSLYITAPFKIDDYNTYDVLVSSSGNIKIQFYKGKAGEFNVRKNGRGNDRSVNIRGALEELGMRDFSGLHGYYHAKKTKTYVMFNINERMDEEEE